MIGESRVIEAELENGTRIGIETTVLHAEQDVAARHLIFDNLSSTIKDICRELASSIEEAKPSKATIEFGLEVGVSSGKLTAILVKGTGTANLKIVLEWDAKSEKINNKEGSIQIASE